MQKKHYKHDPTSLFVTNYYISQRYGVVAFGTASLPGNVSLVGTRINAKKTVLLRSSVRFDGFGTPTPDSDRFQVGVEAILGRRNHRQQCQWVVAVDKSDIIQFSDE